MMGILIAPLQLMGLVLIVAPLMALIPALFFSFLYRKTQQNLSLISALLWGIYTIYEYGMKFRILCDGECNIRVDLLLIYPLLVLISLLAIVGAIRNSRRNTLQNARRKQSSISE